MTAHRLWLTLCAALLLSPAVLPAQTAATPQSVQMIRALEERRFAAMMRRDTEALAAMLSDDLTYTHSSGQLETKGQFLDSIRNGAIQYTAILPEGLDVRLYGETAVVTGKGTFKVRMQGEDRSLQLRFTDVYVRRGDGWQMVAWQSTRLPE
jgi:ketosteroid isomerase-like protein